MRRLLKFLHTLGAVGLMGSMAALAVMLEPGLLPAAEGGRIALIEAMARVSGWIFMPSLALTLVAGLLSIAVTPGFQDAAWAWIKAATGISMFEGGLVYVQGPIQAAAKAGAAGLAQLPHAEHTTLIALIVISAANVALGIWRPRTLYVPV